MAITGLPFVTYRQLGRAGRLGNQFFQIAATIGCAVANNMRYVFPPWRWAKYFRRQLPTATIPPGLPETRKGRDVVGYIPLVVEGNTTLRGWFHSEQYFKHCEKLVRSHFVPIQSLINKLQRRLPPSQETVGIHVRRGDKMGIPGWIDYLKTDYYQRGMEFFPDHTFIVASEDIAACKRFFKGANIRFLEGGNCLEDLLTLSLCDHQIIAASTFSWWSAWLNTNPEKVIITPYPWHRKYPEIKDLLPEEWLRVGFDS